MQGGLLHNVSFWSHATPPASTRFSGQITDFSQLGFFSAVFIQIGVHHSRGSAQASRFFLGPEIGIITLVSKPNRDFFSVGQCPGVHLFTVFWKISWYDRDVRDNNTLPCVASPPSPPKTNLPTVVFADFDSLRGGGYGSWEMSLRIPLVDGLILERFAYIFIFKYTQFPFCLGLSCFVFRFVSYSSRVSFVSFRCNRRWVDLLAHYTVLYFGSMGDFFFLQSAICNFHFWITATK